MKNKKVKYYKDNKNKDKTIYWTFEYEYTCIDGFLVLIDNKPQ